MKTQIYLSIVLAFLLIVIPNISALEFDNIKAYDYENKEVTITNSFLGIPTSEIAKAKLNTPQINYVMAGKDRLVAEFTIDLKEDNYKDVIKNIELYNNKNSKRINRVINYKYKVVEQYQEDINDYQEICTEGRDINLSTKLPNTICSKKLVGTHKETRERITWIPLQKIDLIKGTITIGLFTDVYKGDNIEWIPYLFGVRVNEWATWTDSFNTDLVSYWKFDDGAGTTAIDSFADNDLHNQSTGYNMTSAGIIGNSLTFNSIMGNFLNGSIVGGANGVDPNFTISYWANFYSAAAQNVLLLGNDTIGQSWDSPTNLYIFNLGGDITSSADCVAQQVNKWTLYTMVRNSTTTTLYVNGTLCVSDEGNTGTLNINRLSIGQGLGFASVGLSGSIDEMGLWNRSLTSSEISELYNGGVGITYINSADVNFIENSVSYNATTYETVIKENYQLNISYNNVTWNNVSAIFNYDGTNYSVSQTNYGNNSLFNTQLNVGSILGAKNFFWYLTFNNATNTSLKTSTTYVQTLKSISLGICNATNNITYLNITFKDELTSASINGTLNPLSVIYYLTNRSSYKIYTNTNSTENSVYSLCFSPQDRTVKVELSLTTSSTGYPIRYYSNNQTLTNSTTIDSVSLLAAADGLYQPIVVTDGNGIPINGATVSASNINVGLVEERTTDSNGQISLWLNPNIAHTIITSKTGYPSDNRIINPASTTIYITLGSPASIPENLSITYAEGVTYTINPQNNSLENNTLYTFSFTVNKGTFDISSFGFRLYNSTNNLIGFYSSPTNGGTVTQAYNVGNDTSITMVAYWISNGTTNSVSQTWAIYNTEDTQYSINFFSNRLKTYIQSGMFGLKLGFGLNLICFIIILITTGIVSYKYGLNNPILISVIATILTAIFELGLGLIEMGEGNIKLTAWAIIATIAMIIREGLK